MAVIAVVKLPIMQANQQLSIPGFHATAMFAHLDQESFEYPLWMRRQSVLSSSAKQEKLRHARQFLLTFL